MGIGPVSGIGGLFPMYSAMPVDPVNKIGATSGRSDGVAAAVAGVGSVSGLQKPGSIDTTGHKIGSDGKPEPTKQDKRVGKAECETCKNRKYVDGSNEGDVSFKAPAHIDPNQSALRYQESTLVRHALYVVICLKAFLAVSYLLLIA